MSVTDLPGAQTPQPLTRSDGVNSSFSMTPDGMNIAFVHENPRIPSEIALLAAVWAGQFLHGTALEFLDRSLTAFA